MKVLVTGGAGFVGHHVCKVLQGAGHTVVVIDDLQAGVNLTPTRVELRKKNLRHLEAGELDDVDLVVHAAARADVSANWSCRGERTWLYDENINATVSLLEAMGDDTAVIFLSTCAVYGDTAKGQISRETDPCVATSPYSASKLAGEALVQAYAEKRAVPWHCLRLAGAVGSGLHHGHAADFVKMARSGKIEAKNDGRLRKSFVHVRDVALAIGRIVEGGVPSGVYNVAGGVWSWLDTLAVMKRMSGRSIEVEYADRVHGWIGDPMVIASPAKLASWYAVECSIETGMADALASLGWAADSDAAEVA